MRVFDIISGASSPVVPPEEDPELAPVEIPPPIAAQRLMVLKDALSVLRAPFLDLSLIYPRQLTAFACPDVASLSRKLLKSLYKLRHEVCTVFQPKQVFSLESPPTEVQGPLLNWGAISNEQAHVILTIIAAAQQTPTPLTAVELGWLKVCM
jgi:hypothetical protein